MCLNLVTNLPIYIRRPKDETYGKRREMRVENINFKLNLKTFLLLWYWISLLGLAALEVQTSLPFIFFMIPKIHHEIFWNRN